MEQIDEFSVQNDYHWLHFSYEKTLVDDFPMEKNIICDHFYVDKRYRWWHFHVSGWLFHRKRSPLTTFIYENIVYAFFISSLNNFPTFLNEIIIVDDLSTLKEYSWWLFYIKWSKLVNFLCKNLSLTAFSMWEDFRWWRLLCW